MIFKYDGPGLAPDLREAFEKLAEVMHRIALPTPRSHLYSFTFSDGRKLSIAAHLTTGTVISPPGRPDPVKGSPGDAFSVGGA